MAHDAESDSKPGSRSHALDLVPLFSSSNHDAEMEALAIHTILEANGIPSIVVGPSTIPVLEFQVQVPKGRLKEAEEIVAEAKAAGPAGAAAAQQASEDDAV